MIPKNLPTSMFLKMTPSITQTDYHAIRRLLRINQNQLISKIIKERFIWRLRFLLHIPSIIKMRDYRKSIDDQYLWAHTLKGSHR